MTASLEPLAARSDAAPGSSGRKRVPALLVIAHLLFLAGVVLTAHHMIVFLGILLFFVGFAAATKEHQNPIQLQASLKVGLFLGGLVVLGGPQKWWIEPLIIPLIPEQAGRDPH